MLLSTSGTFPTATAALERPDLVPPGTRTLNMSQIGRILGDERLAPPVKAIFVYNSNPVAVAPEQEQVRAGFAREDLFTVVHDLFATDTVDFADIVLPATTTLEHYDIHKAYGHLYLSLSKPAIEPLGESQGQHRGLPAPGRADGARPPCAARERRADGARGDELGPSPSEGHRLRPPGARGVGAPQRAAIRSRLSPRAGSRRASGKCELYAARLEGTGHDPLAGYVPPRENVTSNPELARRYPLAFISPPAHHFLNSTFSAQPTFVRRESEPSLTIHPRGRRRPRHRRRPAGPHLQRSRLVPGHRACLRRRAAGGRGRAVHLVVEDVPRRPQRQRRHRPGADRHGRRSHLLRRAGRSRPRLVEGLFVAGAVITVVQFVRLRDRRLLPLALLLAFLAGTEAREPWEAWRLRFRVAALASGLVLLTMLSIEGEAARRARRE